MPAVRAVDRDLARRRLASQRLADAGTQGFEHPQDVVGWMLAMQAQDYGQALWAIGSRMRTGPAATVAGIEKAVAAGDILRTWPMRGTIHWVLPQDARWLLRLCGSRQLPARRTRMAQLELTESDTRWAAELLGPELAAGPVTRARCLQVLDDAGLRTTGQRGYTLLWLLAHRELLCFGPMDGKQQTFTLLDHVAPQEISRDLSGEQALAELAARYTAARGPVTARDLASWSGITLTSARTGLSAATADGAVSTISLDGVEYHVPGSQPSGPGPARGTGTQLLAGFDEYLLGYQNREAMLAAEHANAVVPGGNGVFRPMLVLDGQISGTWQRKVTAAGVTITRAPFVSGGGGPVRAARAEAKRYAAFRDLPLVSVD